MTIEEVKGFDAFLWRFCRTFFSRSRKKFIKSLHPAAKCCTFADVNIAGWSRGSSLGS